MPLEVSGFPAEVQVAFFLYGFLEDRYEGMSGSYMGKSWNNIEFLFHTYQIQEPKVTLYYMKLLENISVGHKAELAQRKQKADERKSAGGGKNFTHNVKG
jgi:hypothetical protein